MKFVSDLNETFNDVLVIIPCYRASETISMVVSDLLSVGFRKIIVVDDCCPEGSARVLSADNIRLMTTPVNSGVGAAFTLGTCGTVDPDYKDIRYFAKIDADRQHRACDLAAMVHYIRQHDLLDLVKGNRYLLGSTALNQPLIRRLGNISLTLFFKLASGYWHIGDPVNGLFVIKRNVFDFMKGGMLESRYLFESSILVRGSNLDLAIADHPCLISYQGEKSSLNVKKEIFAFAGYYFSHIYRRIVREYFFPNFEPASISLVAFLLFPVGLGMGLYHWTSGVISGVPTEFGIIAIILATTFTGLLSGLFFFLLDRLKRIGSVNGLDQYLRNYQSWR